MAAPRRTPRVAWLHRSHDQPFHDVLVCGGCACAAFSRPAKSGWPRKMRSVASSCARPAQNRSGPYRVRRNSRRSAAGLRKIALAACRRRSALAAALSGGPGARRPCHALRVRSLHSIALASAIGRAPVLGPQARRAPPRRHASCSENFARGSARPHSQPRTAHVHPGSWRGVSVRRAEPK